jgi:hypothetical protein
VPAGIASVPSSHKKKWGRKKAGRQMRRYVRLGRPSPFNSYGFDDIAGDLRRRAVQSVFLAGGPLFAPPTSHRKESEMDKKLHLLETFPARGNDGNDYVVHGFEHLARLDGMTDLNDQWAPTGLAEYKLSNGERIDVDKSGSMTVARTGVKLNREPRSPS